MVVTVVVEFVFSDIWDTVYKSRIYVIGSHEGHFADDQTRLHEEDDEILHVQGVRETMTMEENWE